MYMWFKIHYKNKIQCKKVTNLTLLLKNCDSLSNCETLEKNNKLLIMSNNGEKEMYVNCLAF